MLGQVIYNYYNFTVWTFPLGSEPNIADIVSSIRFKSGKNASNAYKTMTIINSQYHMT